MDKIFEKFNLYDFMGIWGPGALTVTYYIFTLKDLIYWILDFLKIDTLGLSEGYLVVILYIPVSYILGILLHEFGRKIPIFLMYLKKKKLNDDKKFEEEKEKFKVASKTLKYDKSVDTKRIDSYHSIYALARSMFLCFSVHLVLIIISCLIVECSTGTWVKIFIDILVAVIFFLRAKRYFNCWIDNTIVQYEVLYNAFVEEPKEIQAPPQDTNLSDSTD